MTHEFTFPDKPGREDAESPAEGSHADPIIVQCGEGGAGGWRGMALVLAAMIVILAPAVKLAVGLAEGELVAGAKPKHRCPGARGMVPKTDLRPGNPAQ